MKIDDNHMYHGAALIQIAESDKFTAINGLEVGSHKFENYYKINGNIAIYIKHCSEPRGKFDEYIFNFNQNHRSELEIIKKTGQKIFVVMVCVKDRQICCVDISTIEDLISRRIRKNGGVEEDQYQIIVTAEPGRSLRAYINSPAKKGKMLGEAYVVRRNAFPDMIFE